MAPKKKGAAATGDPGPPLKKAKKDGVVWEWKDGDSWKEFPAVDMSMLEERYTVLGPKAKFVTTEFSFNQGFDTLYEVSFEQMTQKNTDSKKSREIRRKGPASDSSKGALWEWWNDNADWSSFNSEDSALLEKGFAAGTSTPFMTKKLTFNVGFDSLYLFDFGVMTQVNCDSGTSRKIQRTPVGGSKAFGHTKGHDDGYADILSAAATGPTSDWSTIAAKFELGLPAKTVATQKKIGAQSLRKQAQDYGPMVSKDKHGTKCFDEMLQNEKELCGEWIVFYHSYSCAGILYEVQAAVASVLFRFKAEFAGLPRILGHGFKHIPDAKRMLEEFPKWKDQDHNQAFKSVGLCATSSLLAHDSEAPAKNVFLSGYSVGSLKGVLEKLLGSCSVPKAKINDLAKKIIELANKHGLDTCGIPGGKKCKSGRSGHMLQLFLRRELCDKYVYPAFPFGVPDKARDLPLSNYLEKDEAIQGQVRITLNPDIFLRANLSRLFSFSADPTYSSNRTVFIKELVGLLEPILGDKDTRVKAATGIFGGKPPEWWTPEDQSDKAAMPASRYMASSM